MNKKNRATTNTVEILKQRYIGDDADRKDSLQAERINAEVAQMIYDLRKDAGLSQKKLAEMVSTTQSVISRLEDADYNGHSLSMVSRIVKALNRRITFQVDSEGQDSETIQYVFREIIKGLRCEKGLGINEFAKRSGINRDEVVAMERKPNYRPTPLALHRLSKFYGIPQQKLAYLARAIEDIPSGIRQEVSKFAAKSESFAKLTNEEKNTLDEFVKFLRSESKD